MRAEPFEEFQIQQAPASTFTVPIINGEIALFAVSEMTPTYYDFCFADAEYNTCCYSATNTFPGLSHSGDIVRGKDFLTHVKLNKDRLAENKGFCVFISGFQYTKITKFLGTHPAVLVANHADKVGLIIVESRKGLS